MSRHSFKQGVPPDEDGIESRDASLASALARVTQILMRPELAHWRPLMMVALALTGAAKLIAVTSPLFFGEAVNRLSEGEPALSAALIGLALWSGARFLSTGLPYIRDYLFAPISQDAQRLIAVDAFGKAQHLSLRFHLTRRTGALNRIIDRGAGALDFLIRFLGFNIAPTLIELILAAIVLTVSFGWQLAAAAVATVAAYVVFTLNMTEWRVKQRRRMNEMDTQLRASAVDSLTNFETVKAFAAEDRETQRYDQFFQSYSSTYVSQTRSLALLNAGQELIMNVGLLALTLFAAMSVAGGRLGPGDIAASVLIMMNLYRPLNMLGWAWREIKQGGVDLEKMFGLLDQEPEIVDAPDAVEAPAGAGEIRFDHVSFAHDGRSAGLVDVSFEAPAGKTLALVGPSGSGKSTLLKLMFRFFDVDAGGVIYNGRDVKTMNQISLREKLGLVPQDVVLFNATVRDNILYGRPDASQEELEAAAEQAQLLEFIKALPEGWDTRVGERGLKLSGGEKQRVGIARAILKDPEVLLLDEATSALDSTTEAEVQKALDIAARGRTTIVVAHRLSTIVNADEILVLEKGRIVERGRHEALLAHDGLYARMWRRQSSKTDAGDATEDEEALTS